MEPGPIAPRILRLTERRPGCVRLSAADATYLLARHRRHFRLAPTPRRDHYTLTPLGCAGVVTLSDCRLVVRPKIPLANLRLLLDPNKPLTLTDGAAPSPMDGLLDLLATRLVRLVRERLTAGLHRGYAERAAVGPFLQGRLDLAAQMRAPLGRKDQLHSRHDDFTHNVPCNALIKATIEEVRRSPLLGDGVRGELDSLLFGFLEVESADLRYGGFERLTGPLPDGYGPLLTWCSLLVDGLAPGLRDGVPVGPAFLLDLEQLFERYVTGGLVEVFADRPEFGVALGRPTYLRAVASDAALELRPDAVVRRRGEPWAVVDAKWKSLGATPFRPADVYQVMTYATVLGAPRAVLAYPGRRERSWQLDVGSSAVRLEVRTLRIVGGREACLESRRRLAASLTAEST